MKTSSSARLFLVLFITGMLLAAANTGSPLRFPFFRPSSASAASPSAATTTLPLGTAVVMSGPTLLNGETYYDVRISCASLGSNIRATVKYGDPTGGAPLLGTILFESGAAGTSYWDQWSTEALRVVNELRASGYRVVQYKWPWAWYQGTAGRNEGIQAVNCRAATLTRWVYDNLHQQSTTQPFCAYGHSNGAAELAYSITQYGLSNLFSQALLNSGPNWSRVDQGCIQADPAYQSLWWGLTDRQTIDASFGQPTNGTGPCATKNASWQSAFYQTSLASPDWSLVFPNTMVTVMMGDQDTTVTSQHGYYFYNKMVADGSPLTQLAVVPNAGHNTFSTVAGANAIRDSLLSECYLR